MSKCLFLISKYQHPVFWSKIENADNQELLDFLTYRNKVLNTHPLSMIQAMGGIKGMWEIPDISTYTVLDRDPCNHGNGQDSSYGDILSKRKYPDFPVRILDLPSVVTKITTLTPYDKFAYVVVVKRQYQDTHGYTLVKFANMSTLPIFDCGQTPDDSKHFNTPIKIFPFNTSMVDTITNDKRNMFFSCILARKEGFDLTTNHGEVVTFTPISDTEFEDWKAQCAYI